MTDREWDVLTAYVKQLRDSLRLSHWEVSLSREAPDGEAEAGDDPTTIDGQMQIQREGYVAEMRVHPKFREGKPEDQRETVIHELLHLHLDTVYSDMTDLIEGFAAKQAFEAVNLINRRNYERMTQAMAAAIAPKYPLIDWGFG